jgi:hypothetical protein
MEELPGRAGRTPAPRNDCVVARIVHGSEARISPPSGKDGMAAMMRRGTIL